MQLIRGSLEGTRNINLCVYYGGTFSFYEIDMGAGENMILLGRGFRLQTKKLI